MTQISTSEVSMLRLDKACFIGEYEETILVIDSTVRFNGRESVETLHHEEEFFSPTSRTTQ
jgi:hypothetical protein